MKLWMKYLLAAAVGAIIAFVLPANDAGISSTLAFLSTLSVRIGRYVLLPLVLFSVPVAVYELNEDKQFWKLLLGTCLILLASVMVFALVGVLTAALSHPARIPLLSDTSSTTAAPSFRGLLLDLFPSSFFGALTEGDYLLPVYFMAILLGITFSFDKNATKPALTLFDSFSRIFYQLNSFFVEFLGILMIFVTAASIFAFRESIHTDVYTPLLIVVGVELLVMTLVVIPAVLYFACGRKNPYRYIYALLGPALIALVSGDVYFAFGALMRHAKESLYIKRRSNAAVLPLAIVFGRAGTVLVTATAFIVVLSSYSNIGISPGSLLWILAISPLVALLLGAAPGQGVLAALMVVCSLYGKGFENGFLIVAPVAAPLASAGAFLDTLWAGCISLMISKHHDPMQEKEIRFYI